MTKAENKKFSRHKEVKGVGYQKYDNFDAIEVPYTDAIPSDHAGVMGVPISFLDKYSPEQFEIVEYPDGKIAPGQWIPRVNGTTRYARVLIRHRERMA
jgi:Adenine-specific methyltransferase EcoRI